MHQLVWILFVLASGCAAQVPTLSPKPGEEIRQTYYPDSHVREIYVVRRYLIVDTAIAERLDPPHDLRMVIDSAEHEFRVGEYVELYPNGKLKVRGAYGYWYGVDYKDGPWVHFSETGDTLLFERYTRYQFPDTIDRIDLKLHH